MNRTHLERFNNNVRFFLENYQERIKQYEREVPDEQVLRELNQKESRVIRIIKRWMERLTKEVEEANPDKVGHIEAVNHSIELALDSVEDFIDDEKNYLEGESSLEDLKKELKHYKAIKSAMSFSDIQALLSEVDDSKVKGLKKRLLRYFSPLKSFRNMWVYPAVFVELFTLVYSTWLSLVEGVEWEHIALKDYILFYFIIVGLMALKLPDQTMRIYDYMIENAKKQLVQRKS